MPIVTVERKNRDRNAVAAPALAFLTALSCEGMFGYAHTKGGDCHLAIYL